jgi:hypothetical protein
MVLPRVTAPVASGDKALVFDAAMIELAQGTKLIGIA